MKRINELNLMIGGYAGQGVNTVGDAFAGLCVSAGLNVFVNFEYPSNIRGEHNYAQVAVSEEPVGSHVRPVDLLLALDAKSVRLHEAEVVSGGALIYDSSGLEVSQIDTGLKVDGVGRDDITVVDIPFKKIAEDVGGSSKMMNTIGLGAVCGLLEFDFDLFSSRLRLLLSKFEEKIIRENLEGAKRAYDEARSRYSARIDLAIEKRDAPDRMLLNGNHAVAMGALKAGLKFYSSYPMSPSSAVLSYLTRHARDFGLVTILPEDEISAVGMAIGASFAGVRAMTGTSGGGFCLMSEHLGLAGMTEIPIVILDGQRPGPATGLPTRTEQGDLSFVLSAHQGDFRRIVLAPGDPTEAFHLTHEAFNLADRYQTPVIILSDKHLAESARTCAPFDTSGLQIDRGETLTAEDLANIPEYKRYMVTDSGISPRSLPGTRGGVFKATGNEHNESGLISEDADNRARQMEKRLRKTDSLDVSDIGAEMHGDPDAEVTFLGWGSTKSVILEAMSVLRKNRGLRCNFLQVIYMEPFPSNRVAEVITEAKRTILIENSATGQLGDLIARKTGCRIKDRILKYDGRQFFRDELAELIEKHL